MATDQPRPPPCLGRPQDSSTVCEDRGRCYLRGRDFQKNTACQAECSFSTRRNMKKKLAIGTPAAVRMAATVADLKAVAVGNTASPAVSKFLFSAWSPASALVLRLD